MIQRVQTIFLALAAMAMFSMLFLPIWAKQGGTESAVLDSMGLVHYDAAEVLEQTNTMYIAGLALVAAAIALGSLFSYKSRPKQIKLNLLNSLVLFALAGINVYWIFYEGVSMFAEGTLGRFGFGFYMPFVALVMNSLANRFIMRDERMVRSADRIR